MAPQTKLATTRWWQTTTLAEDFAVRDANESELYAAMDWLLRRQGTIEKKLATRHLSVGGLVLYDLTSSYFEGTTCPLAKRGYSRDGKRGLFAVGRLLSSSVLAAYALLYRHEAARAGGAARVLPPPRNPPP